MNKVQEVILKNQLTELVNKKAYPQAENMCAQMLQVLPKDSQLWFIYGQVLQALNKNENAVKALLNASQPESELATQALELAISISSQCQLSALGFMAAQLLLKYQPEAEMSLFSFAQFAGALHLNDLASSKYAQLVSRYPDDSKYRVPYAKVLNHLGRNDLALEQYEAAKALDPADDEPYFRGLFAQNYSSTLADQEIAAAHKAFGCRLEAREPNVEKFAPRSKGKRIKVAYVSKDFLTHSVAYFFLAMIRNHNTEQFEVFCYSDSAPAKADAITQLIKQESEHWVECQHLNDHQLYKKIRQDEIDILVDLIGLTGEPRSGVYAKKAAPIQMNYLAYPNTYGLSRMDYRITDNWADPEGLTEQYHSEKLIRLAGGFLCYTPEFADTEVAELPALKGGKVTFGSFNVYPKITDQIFSAWAEILLRVPDSQLLIKANIFNEKTNLAIVEEKFESLGIKKERLMLLGAIADKKSHLQVYDQVDIHLDTYPYNGTTTTCEALWQGVPTLTLQGKSHRSRVGTSILSQVGLEDFIAQSFEEYIDLAVAAASKLPELADLRRTMRQRLQNSLMLDGKRFMSELEAAYSQVMPGSS